RCQWGQPRVPGRPSPVQPRIGLHLRGHTRHPHAGHRPGADRPASLPLTSLAIRSLRRVQGAGSVLALAALLPACGAPLGLDPVQPVEPRKLDLEVLELARVKIEAVRADPSNARAHGTLGLLYEANSLWAAAAASFDNASRLDPREALWRYHRSIALREA